MTAMSMGADLRYNGDGWSSLQHPPGAMRAVLAIGAAAAHRVGAERCAAAESQPDVEVAVRGGCCKWAMRGHGYGCRGGLVGWRLRKMIPRRNGLSTGLNAPLFFISEIGRYERVVPREAEQEELDWELGG